jgi:hypothetical protein
MKTMHYENNYEVGNKQLKWKRQQLGAHHHMVAMLVVA